MKSFFSKLIKTYLMFFVICSYISCTYSHSSKIEDTYKFYYDSEDQHLKMSGDVDSGLEDGTWNFFNIKGELICKGIYKAGMPIGNWEYSLGRTNYLIDWKPSNANGFIFSMPSGFSVYKADENDSNITYIGKLDNSKSANDSKAVFSVSFLTAGQGKNIGSYIYKTLQDDRKSFAILSNSLFKIITDSQSIYVDKLYLQNNKLNMFMTEKEIYTQFDNKIMVFICTCSPEDSIIGNYLDGEIFYHSFYKGNRIASPLVKLKDVIKIDTASLIKSETWINPIYE